jgi:hypothetical protein
MRKTELEAARGLSWHESKKSIYGVVIIVGTESIDARSMHHFNLFFREPIPLSLLFLDHQLGMALTPQTILYLRILFDLVQSSRFGLIHFDSWVGNIPESRRCRCHD